MRRREVTNSPSQEWQARQELGTTEPLPQHIAAAILAKYTRAQVKRRMISLKIDGKSYRFTHENSSVILNHNDDGTFFLIRYNPLDFQEDPDNALAHVHTMSGRYIESLPVKDKAKWFDPESTRKEIARQKTIQTHQRQLIETVRQPVAEAELEREQHNAEQLRAFATLPVPKTTPAKQDQRPQQPQRVNAPQTTDENRVTTPPVPATTRTCKPVATGQGTTPQNTPETAPEISADDFEDFADAIAELKAKDATSNRLRKDYRAAALAAFDED